MQLTDSLRSAIHAVMETGPVPGLAIALLDHETISSEGFGVMRSGENQPVTEETVFSAASLTKPLVAYLALLLVDQGTLDLDTPLRHYLAQAYLPDEPRADQITLRHVLSHQCGLPNWRPKDQPLVMHCAPGERFCYSGEGYNYLQKSLEQSSGQRLDALLHDRLLQPLGMSSSSLIWQPFMEGRAASGHGADRTWDMPHMDIPNSAYSLYTTLRDYARFVQMLLFDADDATPAALRLSHRLREQMFVPQVQVGEWPALFWGLGWGIQSTASGNLFWHWGANPGYRHYVAFSSAWRTGVVILTNYQEGLYACREIIAHLDEPSLDVAHPAFDWLLPANTWQADGRKGGAAQTR